MQPQAWTGGVPAQWGIRDWAGLRASKGISTSGIRLARECGGQKRSARGWGGWDQSSQARWPCETSAATWLQFCQICGIFYFFHHFFFRCLRICCIMANLHTSWCVVNNARAVLACVSIIGLRKFFCHGTLLGILAMRAFPHNSGLVLLCSPFSWRV